MEVWGFQKNSLLIRDDLSEAPSDQTRNINPLSHLLKSNEFNTQDEIYLVTDPDEPLKQPQKGWKLDSELKRDEVLELSSQEKMYNVEA